ncbi:MAG: ABC transporter permease [Lachnospiraceae bacterium]|nr:ABC transporter permease [Lachnospiraceae bacterium]
MLRYELKKIFVKPGGKIALLLLAVLLGVTCWFATDRGFINEQGNSETGIGAMRKLRSATKEWAGELTEERLAEVIAENARINALPGYWGDDGWATDMGYGWKQGIDDINDMLCHAFGKFREYDYRIVDSLTPEDAGQFYERRILQLKEWLSGADGDIFSDKEKEFLIHRFEELETPLYYDYMIGWDQLFEFAPTVIMITVLILGFLAAGIFSGEFQLKADAVFFSSRHGRDKGSAAKLGAGLVMVTVIYWVMILLYSVIVLGYLGADGAGCPIQITGRGWKSFNNITIFQEYLLIIFGGYLGVLFMLLLVMLVSAKAKSAVLAVTVPFLFLFAPNFLMMIPDEVINKICGLLPDQLLQMNMVVGFYNLYQIGGIVTGAAPILIAVYLPLTVILCPVIYQVYRRAEAG